MTGTRTIAPAIRFVAKERTASLTALLHVGLLGIEALFRPLRIDNDPLPCPFSIQITIIVIAAPFPDVARHVIKAITVGRK